MKAIVLPKNVEFIIDRLNKHGYRADVVGGAIRDLYIGREAGDYDITTAASPDKIKEIFSDVRTIDTGIKHGTVTIHLDGENFEVTTYRRDGEYKDARHPESVEFTSELSEDLSRRDFTVNAICYNPKDGFTDLFGGCDDVRARVIRAVGDAEVRFSEDALRILRALRFASVLDFSIEKDTADAVHRTRELLRKVSRERIYTEWYKLVGGRGAYRVILENKDVISVFLPELADMTLPDESHFLSYDTDTRMISLFVGLDNAPRAFDNAMRSLKTDNKIRLYGKGALELYSDFFPRCIEDVLLAFSKYGVDLTEGAVRLGCLTGRFSDFQMELLDRARESDIPYNLASLAINGKDLIELGYKGEKIGGLLLEALINVINGRVENEREALLLWIKSAENQR